jgi:peptidylprolyl isomerase
MLTSSDLLLSLCLQFFITFAPTAWLDGKHVVFGQVAEGWQTLNEMEAAGTDNGSPTKSVTMKRCSIA